ncbi:MAG: hypothetical protein KDC56_01695 [Flavobacteriaceae bacterium]|nr:hypothetical protein [Flavobacteriaceae bacterium]
MDPNKKKQRQDFDESKIIVDAGIALNEFWKTVPQDLEILGVNVAKEISPRTDAKKLMTLFGSYDTLLRDYNNRIEVAFEKAGLIVKLLSEIQNIGKLTPEEQFKRALSIDDSILDNHNTEGTKNMLLVCVMDDIRNGYNRNVEDYAYLLMSSYGENGEYGFDLSLLYTIGQGVAFAAIEALLIQELERIERIKKEEIEDHLAIDLAKPEEIFKTSELIVVLDSLGIIDHLKSQTATEFQAIPDFTKIANMISRFTGYNIKTIRPILRELGAKSKNDPYKSEKNCALFDSIRGEFGLGISDV